MFLHRVGEKRLQHSPFVVIPPHASLSPVATRLLPACYPRYPVPKHSGCTGCNRCNRFSPLYIYFPVFSLYPPHFISIFPLFSTFVGKSIESIASIANHCVLNLNLTDGSKTNLWKKYSKQSAIYCSWYTPETVGTG